MELCDFLAEDELIEIVPNFKYEQVLNLINGDFGPFKPSIPTRVPLWMALNLFRQQKCKINLPTWINELDRLIDEQDDSPGLIKMPCNHWREVIKLLESHQIKLPNDLYKQLITRRDNILKRSVSSLLKNVIDIEDDKIALVKIKNITKFELTTLKKMIALNLAFIKEIQPADLRKKNN